MWLRAADLGRKPALCVVQAVANTAFLAIKLRLAVDEGVAALAGVAKLVYAPDLGSGGLVSWGFKSLRPHHSYPRGLSLCLYIRARTGPG